MEFFRLLSHILLLLCLSLAPNSDLRETRSQRRGLQLRSCQIGIEITDYTGDKILVGVARPSHILRQSVPCDG